MPGVWLDREGGVIVVLRLVGPPYEGEWIEVHSPPVKMAAAWDGWPGVKIVSLVTTGCVEWDGDRCAEVYVPEDRLELWRAEHDI